MNKIVNMQPKELVKYAGQLVKHLSKLGNEEAADDLLNAAFHYIGGHSGFQENRLPELIRLCEKWRLDSVKEIENHA